MTQKASEPDTRTAKVNGRDWVVPMEALDDFEVLDDIARWEAGDASRAASMMRRLLGDEQAAEALASLRDPKTGRVSTADGYNFVGDLLRGLNPNS